MSQTDGAPPCSGFLSLPCEILLEIASYFGLPLSCNSNHTVSTHGPLLFPPTTLERQADIRSLMHTCRTTRSYLVPFYWKHLDMCFDRALFHQADRKAQERHTKFVLGHLKAVVAASEASGPEECAVESGLAQYVRSLSITLYQPDLHQILDLLKQCMGLCTSLDTIQVVGDLYTMKRSHNTITEAFNGLAFHNIHTACLMYRTHGIMDALPGLKNLYWLEEGRKNILDVANLKRLKLESFSGLSPCMIQSYTGTIDGDKGIELLFGEIRTLEISLEGATWFDFASGLLTPRMILQPLSGLRHLQTLCIRFPDQRKPHLMALPDQDHIASCVEFAKRWLASTEWNGTGPRALVVLKDGEVVQRIQIQHPSEAWPLAL